MTMKTSCLAKQLILAVGLIPLLAFGSQAPSASNTKKIVTVTTHPTYEPVTFINKKNNKIEGAAVELTQIALSRMGYETKLVNTGSWARAQAQVKSGAIDILLPPYKTVERQDWMWFQTRPILDDETGIFVRKNSSLLTKDPKSIQQLIGSKGVAIINDSFGDEFDRLDKEKLKMDRLASTELCFRFVQNGRADFAIAGLYAGKKVLKDMGIEDQLTYLPLRAVITGMYIGISKASPLGKDDKFRQQLETQLDKIRQDGTLQNIKNKYQIN